MLLGSSILVTGAIEAQRAPAKPFLSLPAPVVTIGTEGDPDYEFVSIQAALHLPGGGIAVSDRQTQAIRIFSDRGRLVRKLGRNGSGPGEFRSIDAMIAAGDTIILYDWQQRRLTRYLSSGPLIGTQLVNSPSEEGSISISGRLSGGRWLVTTLYTPTWDRGHGVYRDSQRVGTLPAQVSGEVRWLGKFPGMYFLSYMPSEDRSRWSVGPVSVSPNAVVRTAGDTILIGDTGTPDLQFFLPGGHLVRRLAIPLEGTVDPGEQRAAARREGMARTRDEKHRAYVAAVYEAKHPAPRYESFTVADDGELWVRLFAETPVSPVRYLVLGPSGEVRRRVSLPP